MRPSSSSSDESSRRGLFEEILARGEVWEATTSEAWLQAMLDAEAALALALADIGAVPRELANEIDSRCDAARFDLALVARRAADGGNPVIPLVDALASAVSAEAADVVHRGATSQDILDTAAMLVIRRSLDTILADLDGCTEVLTELARSHRATAMSGRTLLQHAVPTTFGLVAAGWLLGVDAALGRLRAVRERTLTAQLGGAAGTLESFGELAPEVVARFATRVGLAAPLAPWHTERSRVADLAGALGTTGASIGKAATDIVLLAQTEIAELREVASGRGGSSAMPHKHNPVAAVSARASVLPVPGLVSTLLAAAQLHELQRAAGAWHAEWETLVHLLRAVGSGSAWLRDSLGSLEVDTDRMRVNLDATGGLVLAERVATALAPLLGRRTASEVITEACRQAGAEHRPLFDVLTADGRVTAGLDVAKLRELLDPAQPADAALALVDRILDQRIEQRED